MSKLPAKKKVSVSRKAIAALTLIVALVLSVAFIALGFTGRQMDPQGLYRLLPWLPTPSQDSSWRQALVPGAGLGDTLVFAFSPDAEGEASPEDLNKAVSVLVKRLNDFGWTDTAVEVKDGQLQVSLPKGADTAYLNTILTAKGEYSFTDPAGVPFMDGSNVVSAGFGYADQSGSNIALSLLFDAFGKEAFGQKSIELAGQSISLRRDGVVLASPGIGEPITQGQVSIPGFTLDSARENAVLLRSGALPFALVMQGEGSPASPLLGAGAQSTLLIALLAVFVIVSLYFLVCYRLIGLVAAWMLALQVAFSFFFAALMGAGFTVLTLSAILLAYIITVFAVLSLYTQVRQDLGHGRSLRHALKDSYAGAGHAGLDVIVLLILISVLVIMLNLGLLTIYAELFAVCLLIGLALTQLVLRVLLGETIHLFGADNALFSLARSTKKEA